MNRFAAVFIPTVGMLLSGCATPNVKYSDLRPPTTATVSDDAVMVHVGSDLMNSACFTKPKARVEGQTVLIVGYRTLREQSRDFLVRLPASVSSESISVVWVDPGGSRVPVPITK
jgi:hypothetical protein